MAKTGWCCIAYPVSATEIFTESSKKETGPAVTDQSRSVASEIHLEALTTDERHRIRCGIVHHICAPKQQLSLKALRPIAPWCAAAEKLRQQRCWFGPLEGC